MIYHGHIQLICLMVSHFSQKLAEELDKHASLRIKRSFLGLARRYLKPLTFQQKEDISPVKYRDWSDLSDKSDAYDCNRIAVYQAI